MKKKIFIVAILALVIAASGCTSDQAPPANKTYSANSLSFTYPGIWEELDKTGYQSVLGNKGEIMVVVGDGASSGFGIAKLNSTKNTTLNDLVADYNSTLKDNGTKYVSGKSVIVAGVKGYEMTVTASGNYVTVILFIKNSIGYLVVFESSDSDQQVLDGIMKSLKIP